MTKKRIKKNRAPIPISNKFASYHYNAEVGKYYDLLFSDGSSVLNCIVAEIRQFNAKDFKIRIALHPPK